MTPNMVTLESFSVTGISVQTCNADEMQADNAAAADGNSNDDATNSSVSNDVSEDVGDSHAPKLGILWARFYADYLPCLPDNPSIYGVYYEYESDEQGDYRVLAGSANSAKHNKNIIKETVCVPAGRYLKFSASGAMPDAVIRAWEQVWAYFHDTNCPHERLFSVDVEQYVSLSEVHLYIGVK